ncbi:MAG: hypothetical protein M0004_03300 [Actinomycetota bacterium]|nr:hypothetical protein [Actinomycetota bacterium]
MVLVELVVVLLELVVVLLGVVEVVDVEVGGGLVVVVLVLDG